MLPVRKPAPPRPRSRAALICSMTRLRAPVDQHLVERLIAAHRDVFLNVRGIDEPAVAQHNLLLPLEERNRVPGGNIRITLAVFQVRGDVIPFLDLAVDQIGGHDAGGDAFQNARGVVGLHAVQHHQRISRQPHAHQRLLKAGAEAAHAGQHHIQAAALDGLIQGVKDLFGAIAAAAGSHPHRHARNGRHQLGKPGFTNRVERANILNSRHYFLPCPV